MIRSLLVVAAVACFAPAQSITWEHDYNAALKRAKAEKKLVFMDLYAEWCGPCKRLKNDVFPKPEAEQALKDFVPLALLVEKADGTRMPEGSAIAAQVRLTAYPTLLILDADGREVRRHEGAFRTPQDLATWLKQK